MKELKLLPWFILVERARLSGLSLTDIAMKRATLKNGQPIINHTLIITAAKHQQKLARFGILPKGISIMPDFALHR